MLDHPLHRVDGRGPGRAFDDGPGVFETGLPSRTHARWREVDVLLLPRRLQDRLGFRSLSLPNVDGAYREPRRAGIEVIEINQG